jgi:hypothetical protein
MADRVRSGEWCGVRLRPGVRLPGRYRHMAFACVRAGAYHIREQAGNHDRTRAGR